MTRLVLILLLAAIALPGCAKSPRTQWAQGREALTEVTRQLSDAAEAGKLDKTEILLADVGIQAARAALEDADVRITQGDTEAFRGDMRMLKVILQRLAETYLLPQPPPATQPTP